MTKGWGVKKLKKLMTSFMNGPLPFKMQILQILSCMTQTESSSRECNFFEHSWWRCLSKKKYLNPKLWFWYQFVIKGRNYLCFTIQRNKGGSFYFQPIIRIWKLWYCQIQYISCSILQMSLEFSNNNLYKQFSIFLITIYSSTPSRVYCGISVVL